MRCVWGGTEWGRGVWEGLVVANRSNVSAMTGSFKARPTRLGANMTGSEQGQSPYVHRTYCSFFKHTTKYLAALTTVLLISCSFQYKAKCGCYNAIYTMSLEVASNCPPRGGGSSSSAFFKWYPVGKETTRVAVLLKMWGIAIGAVAAKRESGQAWHRWKHASYYFGAIGEDFHHLIKKVPRRGLPAKMLKT